MGGMCDTWVACGLTEADTVHTAPTPGKKRLLWRLNSKLLTPQLAAKEKVSRPSDCYLFIDLILNTQVWEMTD